MYAFRRCFLGYQVHLIQHLNNIFMFKAKIHFEDFSSFLGLGNIFCFKSMQEKILK